MSTQMLTMAHWPPATRSRAFSNAGRIWLGSRTAMPQPPKHSANFSKSTSPSLLPTAAALRPVFADLAAADLVHRRVVADHRDIGQAEALRGFHVPCGHAEGTVAVVTQHFFLRMDELGRHRERSADAQGAERPGVHPVAGFARLHCRRGNRHDVAAVADVDRVVGQKFVDLVSDAIRIDRHRIPI